jgi:hypothetical protein
MAAGDEKTGTKGQERNLQREWCAWEVTSVVVVVVVVVAMMTVVGGGISVAWEMSVRNTPPPRSRVGDTI